MNEIEEGDRKSDAAPPTIITDKEELARQEAENGLRQFDAVVETVELYRTEKRAFKLRPSIILSLHREALRDIHSYAGNFRPSTVTIHGSGHLPPAAHLVPEMVEDMCEYVNEHWESASPLYLAVYVMWRLCWIHPFSDGNGRTARAVSYLVLCMKLGGRLAGVKTIPDLISERKKPYYDALEMADKALTDSGADDVSVLEQYLSNLLAAQLVSVLEQAQGEPLLGDSVPPVES